MLHLGYPQRAPYLTTAPQSLPIPKTVNHFGKRISMVNFSLPLCIRSRVAHLDFWENVLLQGLQLYGFSFVCALMCLPRLLFREKLSDRACHSSGVNQRDSAQGKRGQIIRSLRRRFQSVNVTPKEDKERDEVNDEKVKQKCLFFHYLDELKHKSNAKNTCKLVEDGNGVLLRAPFVAENSLNKISSDCDQAIHIESLKQDTQPKMEATLKRFACEVYGKKFSQKRIMNINMRVYTKEKPFSYTLVKHMRVHTKEKPFCCDICSKAFSEKGTLVNHMRVHTKEKPFSCEICSKAFSQKGNLAQHMRVHTKKSFSEKSTLVRHMRVHTKEKPFSCEICSKAFSVKGNLAQHLRIHTKEKPFSCKICSTTFSEKGHLARHMRVHTKMKPFSCEICSKVFSLKASLVNHMRVHTKEKPLSFEICSKALSETGNLVKHTRVHTKERAFS
ncbi:gastrula zinc finger protein XlCGF57.1-like [Penaeus indicus]|uniref:gastrula zinc finger protein XlCGF57.1-like n=1 Tax=Penaeus indicus TaxID=29960 RepID=UPI00300C5C23